MAVIGVSVSGDIEFSVDREIAPSVVAILVIVGTVLVCDMVVESSLLVCDTAGEISLVVRISTVVAVSVLGLVGGVEAFGTSLVGTSVVAETMP